MRHALVEPSTDQILAYCAEAPSSACSSRTSRGAAQGASRRSSGEDGALAALCHLGTNVVPSGDGCGAFAELAARAGAADADRRAGTPSPTSGSAARRRLGRAARGPARAARVRLDGRRRSPAGPGCARATVADLDLLVPACARAHQEELGVDPLRRDANGFRWRTRVQIEEGRSWLWVEDGVILFKAEASAWTPEAVQLQQVWVDPPARRQGHAGRALRDLIRLLLDRGPRRLPLRARRERRPRSGSTSRSACSTCSTTGASCSERVTPVCSSGTRTRAPTRPTGQLDAAGRGALEPRASRRRSPSRGARARADRAGRRQPLARTQETLELALGGRDVPSSSCPRLDEIGFGVVRGRPPRRLPRLGLDERARRALPGRRREPRGGGRAACRGARRAPRAPGGDDPGRHARAAAALRARRRGRPLPGGCIAPSRTRRRSSSTPSPSSARPRPCACGRRAAVRRRRLTTPARGVPPRPAGTLSGVDVLERIEAHVRAGGADPAGRRGRRASSRAAPTRPASGTRSARSATASPPSTSTTACAAPRPTPTPRTAPRRSAPRSSVEPAAETEAATARAPLPADRGSRPARHRPHGLRPGRDGALPARLERLHAWDQGRGARTASCGRCSTLTRDETEAYCREHGLPCADGPTNPDTKRGLIRDEFLPLLRRLDPRAEANLLALAAERPRLPRALERRSSSSRVARRHDAPPTSAAACARCASTTRCGSRARFAGARGGSRPTPTVSWSAPRRPGDRLAGRRRKVQDLLVDAKVPRAERDGWPLVVDAGDEVVAVPGIADAPGWEGAVRATRGTR